MHLPGDRSPARRARPLALGLLCCVLTAPALAQEHLVLCFEKKVAIPWRLSGPTGLNFDMLELVAARLHLTLKYEALPWKRCLAKMQANQVDGAFSVSYTDDRLVFGAYPGGRAPDVSKKMHDARYLLVRRKDGNLDWDGRQFSKFTGPILFQLGYSIGDMLGRIKVRTEETNDSLNVIGHRVLTGSVAGAALYDSDAALLMRTPIGAQLELAPIPLIEKPYFLMFSHALLKGRPQLAERIWNEIEHVRHSPEYARKAVRAGVQP